MGFSRGKLKFLYTLVVNSFYASVWRERGRETERKIEREREGGKLMNGYRYKRII